MSIVAVLALIIGLLAVVSLLPQASSWPLLSVCCLLAAIALFLVGYR